jgi:TolA-binding protein
MKSSERHHLKQDKLAETLQDTLARLEAQRTRLIYGAVALGTILILVVGYVWYRSDQNNKAAALLADAMVTAEAPVTPPPPPPGVTPDPAPPPPPADSFPTEDARREAALVKFQTAAEAYPSTQPGITARYHAAALLAETGKVDEAREQFALVEELDGRGLYGRMARLAVADLNVRDGNYEPAISTFRELSLDVKGDLPVDAILMQLGRAYEAAGKQAEARQTFQRIGSEFPDSPYATDAEQRVEALAPEA